MITLRPASSNIGKLAPLVLYLAGLPALHGCRPPERQKAEQAETQKAPPRVARPTSPKTKPAPYVPKPVRISQAGAVGFDINWPPRPLQRRTRTRRSLLTGRLDIRGDISREDDPKILIKLTLTRPHGSETDRDFWNAQTEFRQYRNWMPYVRGRDAAGRQWLWPNLAYLFRARGYDRIDRYGGWDKGHSNDNDFGGVLIRKLNDSGSAHSAPPLVSADWRSVAAKDTMHTDVVHAAESDTFTLHPDTSVRAEAGTAKLWFVYGDFMTWRPPWKYAAGPMKRRLLKKEYDGGIIAQFKITWRRCPRRPFKFTITQEIPTDDTHFNWRKWINRKANWDTPKAEPRLSDWIR